MYTVCPGCTTCFAITAAHLRAGHGQVRCGQCGKIFDAIPHLSDDVIEREALARGLGVAPPSPGPAAPVSPGAAPRPTDAGQAPPAPLPRALRDEPQPASSPRRGRELLAGAATVFLLATLLAQYAWFDSEDLVSRYPLAAPAVDAWCALARCDPPAAQRPSAIRVVTRDVRVHPRFEGALRVTATLVSVAPAPAPYPRVRFTLFNVNGQTIATRVFEPREYLGVDSLVLADLAPRVPLQIALELLAPEQAAVSYEFRFL